MSFFRPNILSSRIEEHHGSHSLYLLPGRRREGGREGKRERKRERKREGKREEEREGKREGESQPVLPQLTFDLMLWYGAQLRNPPSL